MCCSKRPATIHLYSWAQAAVRCRGPDTSTEWGTPDLSSITDHGVSICSSSSSSSNSSSISVGMLQSSSGLMAGVCAPYSTHTEHTQHHSWGKSVTCVSQSRHTHIHEADCLLAGHRCRAAVSGWFQSWGC